MRSRLAIADLSPAASQIPLEGVGSGPGGGTAGDDDQIAVAQLVLMVPEAFPDLALQPVSGNGIANPPADGQSQAGPWVFCAQAEHDEMAADDLAATIKNPPEFRRGL
jgi:hypothetical protein